MKGTIQLPPENTYVGDVRVSNRIVAVLFSFKNIYSEVSIGFNTLKKKNNTAILVCYFYCGRRSLQRKLVSDNVGLEQYEPTSLRE